MIYIFSRAIRSGKTTELSEFIANKSSLGGFLSPDKDSRRQLYDIQKRTYTEFQISSDTEQETIEIGRFHFLSSSFEKMRMRVEGQLSDPTIELIIIDEIGKLELQKRGFHKLFSHLISNAKNHNIIIVVRKSLLEKVIEFYKITDYEVVSDLKKLPYQFKELD